jgi:hypothetical protein
LARIFRPCASTTTDASSPRDRAAGGGQTSQAFGRGDSRRVAEVAAGAADVEVVRRAELRGQEPCHSRLALDPQHTVYSFQHRADPPGSPRRDRLADLRQAGLNEDLVDPVPAVHRLSLTDEIGAAGDGRSGRQCIGRLQMSFGSVFHVDHVDPVRAVSHAAQLPGPRALDQPRNQVPVARPPDQVRPQRAGESRSRLPGGTLAPISLQHLLLRQRLAVRIMAQPPRGIRDRFVDAALIRAVERHARAAGVDQSRHARSQTAVDDVTRPQRVDAVVIIPRSPDAGDSGRMKHHVHPLAGRLYRCRGPHISLHHFNAQSR